MTLPVLSMVTLGVADVEAAAGFYARWGFPRSSDGNGKVAFFNAGGVVLAVYDRGLLARDTGVQPGPARTGSTTLALNCATAQQVDDVFGRAIGAGARSLNPPAETEWGGYAGYVADPEGHAWEIAHNPFWPFDDLGHLVLPM
jgi:predicted lactoylglutathione lyase